MNQVERAYNGLGQLTSEWQAHSGAVTPGVAPRVQYAYSFAPSGSTNQSRPTGITYPNGRAVAYDYGTAGGLDDRVSRLAALDGTAVTFEQYRYLGLGTVVERAHPQPGIDLTYVKQGAEATGDAGDQYIGLDRFGRIIDQRWRKTSDNSNVDRTQYAYDRDSNRTSRTNVVNTAFDETYTYDGLNQLTGFNTTGTAKTWDYDAVGNWDGVTTNATTETRTHNRQNEIGSATGQTSPTYDANGNQTTDFGNLGYTYDAWNRPRTGGTRTYEYDGLGRRAQQTSAGVTTDYYYDQQWRVLEDRVTGVVNQYVWSGAGYVDELVLRDRDTNADGSLEERLYAAQDANYNVTALFGNLGGVQERYAYDPYGTRTIYNPAYTTVRAGSTWLWVFGFQGLRLDTTTGKYQARNRDYDPAQGRWLEMDPSGFDAGDVDLYRYTGNSPASTLDPTGLFGIIAKGVGEGPQSGRIRGQGFSFFLGIGLYLDDEALAQVKKSGGGYIITERTITWSFEFCDKEDFYGKAKDSDTAWFIDPISIQDGKLKVNRNYSNGKGGPRLMDKAIAAAYLSVLNSRSPIPCAQGKVHVETRWELYLGLPGEDVMKQFPNNRGLAPKGLPMGMGSDEYIHKPWTRTAPKVGGEFVGDGHYIAEFEWGAGTTDKFAGCGTADLAGPQRINENDEVSRPHFPDPWVYDPKNGWHHKK